MKMTPLEKIRREYGPTTVALLKKQCSIIKVDYKKINFADPYWYQDYTWTKKQQDGYKKWFINYLFGNLKRTKEVSRFADRSYKSKCRLDGVWHFWNLYHGWRRSDYAAKKR